MIYLKVYALWLASFFGWAVYEDYAWNRHTRREQEVQEAHIHRLMGDIPNTAYEVLERIDAGK